MRRAQAVRPENGPPDSRPSSGSSAAAASAAAATAAASPAAEASAESTASRDDSLTVASRAPSRDVAISIAIPPLASFLITWYRRSEFPVKGVRRHVEHLEPRRMADDHDPLRSPAAPPVPVVRPLFIHTERVVLRALPYGTYRG